MKMIVEQIVSVDKKTQTVKKVRLATLTVDIPPVSAGDDLWFINKEDTDRRTRLTAFYLRMAVDDDEVFLLVDAITPELLAKANQKRHDASMGQLTDAAYKRATQFTPDIYRQYYLGDVEAPAPDEVELEPEKTS